MTAPDHGYPWTHGTRLGREHRSVREHLVEDHAHGRTWAYSLNLPHPKSGGAMAEIRNNRQET